MAYISLSITLYFSMQEINENHITQLQPRGTYQKHTEREYWGVYWLRYKVNWSLRRISLAIEISKATVQSIIKRIDTKDSPLPSLLD
jgi:hypothetical protein